MAKKKQPTRQEEFQAGVVAFRDSKQTANDYLEFVQVSGRALRQGIGLSWGEIEAILEKEIGKFND